MIRYLSIVALVGLSLATWGATAASAQVRPQLPPRPDQPRLSLKQYGLLVTGVVPGGTAQQQGIEAGDIIRSVNGNAVRSLNDLHYQVGRSGMAAALGVIDCRTGWLNQVMVYPRNGRIGVLVQPVP